MITIVLKKRLINRMPLWFQRPWNKFFQWTRLGRWLVYHKDYGPFVDLKFAIARGLDKNPKYCWANLVMWALGYTPWWSILFPDSNEHNQTHLQCTESSGGAYCGKCRKNGRLSK